MSFNEIKKHYSEMENRLPRLVLKEYLQYEILEIVFSSKFGGKIIFMGETSVRIVYGNGKFSEDLDLDNCGLSENNFAELMEIIRRELKKRRNCGGNQKHLLKRLSLLFKIPRYFV